jgi:ATP phosphoribosyltransferase
VWQTGRSLRSKGLHFLETLAAQDARLVQADPKQFALVSKRLEALLKKDLENQGGRSEMKQKLAEFQKDPVAWLKVNLAPREYETRTTIDWQRWIPRQE